MKHVNVSIKIIRQEKNIIFGNLAHKFVRVVSI